MIIAGLSYGVIAILFFIGMLSFVKKHKESYKVFTAEVILLFLILSSVFWPLFLLYGVWSFAVYFVRRWIES